MRISSSRTWPVNVPIMRMVEEIYSLGRWTTTTSLLALMGSLVGRLGGTAEKGAPRKGRVSAGTVLYRQGIMYVRSCNVVEQHRTVESQ